MVRVHCGLLWLLLLLLHAATCAAAPLAGEKDDGGAAAAESTEEHAQGQSDLVISLMLLGGIGFVLMKLAAVNHKDYDVQRYAWETISSTVSIFAAVLLFQAFNSVIEWAIFWKGISKGWMLVFDSVHMLFWMLVLQYTLSHKAGALQFFGKHNKSVEMHKNATSASLRAQRASMQALLSEEQIESVKDLEEESFGWIELNTKSWATLLGHISGFATINAFGMLQQMMPRNVVCVLLPAPVALGFLMGLYELHDRVREYVARRDKYKDKYEELWDDTAEETEDDMIALVVSFLVVQWLRFCISGELPNQEGLSEAHIGIVGSIILASIGVAAGVLHVVRSMARSSSATRRLNTWWRDIAAMSFAWCLYFSVWESLTGHVFQHDESIAGVVTALIVTFLSMFLMRSLDCVADLDETDYETDASIRALIFSLATLIGFSWERSFDSAIEGVTERTEDLFPPQMTKLLLAVMIVKLVFPTWQTCIFSRVLSIWAEEKVAYVFHFPNMYLGSLEEQKKFREDLKAQLHEKGVTNEANRHLRVELRTGQRGVTAEVRGSVPIVRWHSAIEEVKEEVFERKSPFILYGHLAQVSVGDEEADEEEHYEAIESGAALTNGAHTDGKHPLHHQVSNLRRKMEEAADERRLREKHRTCGGAHHQAPTKAALEDLQARLDEAEAQAAAREQRAGELEAAEASAAQRLREIEAEKARIEQQYQQQLASLQQQHLSDSQAQRAALERQHNESLLQAQAEQEALKTQLQEHHVRASSLEEELRRVQQAATEQAAAAAAAPQVQQPSADAENVALLQAQNDGLQRSFEQSQAQLEEALVALRQSEAVASANEAAATTHAQHRAELEQLVAQKDGVHEAERQQLALQHQAEVAQLRAELEAARASAAAQQDESAAVVQETESLRRQLSDTQAQLQRTQADLETSNAARLMNSPAGGPQVRFHRIEADDPSNSAASAAGVPSGEVDSPSRLHTTPIAIRPLLPGRAATPLQTLESQAQGGVPPPTLSSGVRLLAPAQPRPQPVIRSLPRVPDAPQMQFPESPTQRAAAYGGGVAAAAPYPAPMLSPGEQREQPVQPPWMMQQPNMRPGPRLAAPYYGPRG